MAFILESVQIVGGGGNLGQTERLLQTRFKEYHHIKNKIIIQSSLKISQNATTLSGQYRKSWR